MKLTLKKTVCVLPLFFIETLLFFTLLFFPCTSNAAGGNESRLIQNKQPLFSLEILQQTALKATKSTRTRSQSPRIAIVGAGIAGLTAAYRLNQLGYSSSVYEGSERFGGRILSAQFPNGQIYEKGAELISASDTDLRALVNDLNLSLYVEFPATYPASSAPFTEIVEYQDPEPAPQSPRGNRNLNRQGLYSNIELTNDWYFRTNPNTGLTHR